MTAKLKWLYFSLLLPAVLAGAGSYAARAMGGPVWAKWTEPQHLARGCFISCIIFAVAAPVMQRTFFAHRMRGRKYTPAPDFYRFQKRLIITALLSPYMALAAGLTDLPRLYHAGVILASLYAVYYYYPSNRRISVDARIFRVRRAADDRKVYR